MSQQRNVRVGQGAVRVSERVSERRSVIAAGITGVALFMLMGAFVVPEEAPLHAWAGLAQRIVILVVLFSCTVILTFRLLRVTRAAGASL
jgi:hypothetical protein